MRFLKALHLVVLLVVLAFAAAFTWTTLFGSAGSSPTAQSIADYLFQYGALAYLAFAVCLLVYALKRA